MSTAFERICDELGLSIRHDPATEMVANFYHQTHVRFCLLHIACVTLDTEDCRESGRFWAAALDWERVKGTEQSTNWCRTRQSVRTVR